MRKVGKLYVPDEDTEWTPLIKAGRHKCYMELEIQCAMNAISNRTTGTSSGCAIDVGANIGLFSRRIAQYFPKVLAFEPFYDTYECLMANTPFEVNATQKAVGDHEGQLHMCDPNGQKSSGHRRHLMDFEKTAITADMISLDSIEDFFDKSGLSLIKIDVQGMEWEVVDGAMEVLRKHRPVIILEEHSVGSTTRAFKTTGRILQEIGGDLVGLFKRNVVISL